MFRKILTILVCAAAIIPAFAKTLKDEAFFYDSDMEASYMRAYKITLPDNLSSEMEGIILSNLYPRMNVTPLNLGDATEQFEDMRPMPASMIPKYKPLYDSGNTTMENWEDVAKVEVLTNKPDLLVLKVENYGYWGGAHGGTSLRFLNWNPSENREITLADYVKTDAQRRALRSLLYSKAKRSLGSEISGSKSNFPISTTIKVGANGLTFVYDEYEIACYAAGCPSFDVSFAELKNLGKSGASSSATTKKSTATRKAASKKRR